MEINDAGKVIREIGFNSINVPICFGPWCENSGKWLDSSFNFNPDDYEDLSEFEFVNTWCEVEQERLMKRRSVAAKARAYFEGRISRKEFFDEVYYERDKLINELVDVIERAPFYSKSDPSSHDHQPRDTYDWETKAMINELEK